MAGRVWLLCVVTVLLAALAAGCSSSDDELMLPTPESTAASTQPSRTTEAEPSTTTTEPPAGTSATRPELEIPTEWESDLDEIFGRYLLFWEAHDVAHGYPEADPSYGPLRDLAADAVYDEVVARLNEYRDFGVVSVKPVDSINDHILRLPNPAPLGKEEGREVIIQDCRIQDTEQRTLEGELRQTALSSVLFNVVMQVGDGEWRVASITPASEQSSGYEECTDYLEYLDSPPPCPQCWPYGQE